MPLKPRGGLRHIGGAPLGRDPRSGQVIHRLGGRRALYLDAASAAKVHLSVLPGDVIECSDDVAEQLVAGASQFTEIDTAAVATIVAGHAKREADLEAEAQAWADEIDAARSGEESTPKKAPAKKAAKKAPAKKAAKKAPAKKAVREISAVAAQKAPAARSSVE